MPYTPHPIFNTPSDQNQRIWRYMDLAKFLYLLKTHTLFFCRTDRLEDEFEGALPRPNVIHRHDQFGPIRAGVEVYQKAAKQLWGVEFSIDDARRICEQSADFIETHLTAESFLFRRFTFVNCWHMNEIESAAMWKIFTSSPDSIAIESTFAKLTQSLSAAAPEIYVGTVTYTDYENELLPPNNEFCRFVAKRKSFEYERELRAICREWPPMTTRPDGTQKTNWAADPGPGRFVSVEVPELVARVVVSPRAQPWMLDLVRDLATHFGYTFPVAASQLADSPLF